MQSHRRWLSGRALVRLAALVGCLGGAFGQAGAATEAAGASLPDEQNGLAEIVVTAEKHLSLEQKTPIAMSVLSSEDLQRNGVGNLEDLAALAPSVNFSRSDASSIVTIRGVSSRDTTEIGDPAVAINIDGFYFQRAIGFADSLFDLERVEVLRGPQGTLYGRNATGGAINFVTAKPKRDFEATASVAFGNYDFESVEGALNLPLSDRVQIRASFFTRSHNGYRENGPARNGDDEDAKAARLHVMIEPTDKMTVLLTGEIVKIGGIGPAVYGSPLVYDVNGNVVHTMPPLPSGARAWPLNQPSGFMDSTSNSLRWRFDYDLGFADLSYLGGYRHLDYHSLLDLDGLDTEAYYFQANENPRTWNHEVRLSSKQDQRLTWQVGAFYFQEKNNLLTYYQDYAVPNPPANLYIFTYPTITATSKAGFGQASFAVVDDVKIEAGVRYTSDYKIRVGSLNYGSGTLQEDASSTSSKTTYHVGTDWQVNPTSMLYAKIDTGYKAGGFTDAASYAPETITAYEIGSKNRFLGNTLQLNADAFYYSYKDQQISQFVNGQTFIRNAGASEIYGAELDGSAIVTSADRIDGYIGYLHAAFTDFLLAVGDENVQIAGNHPPQSPSLSLNAGYQHHFMLPNGGSLTARLQTHYEAASYFTVNNYPDDRQGAYTRSDAILTYAPAESKWSIQAYGRNLENSRILANAQENGLWGAYNYQFAPPRTYGVQVSAHW